jgi:eukaryotic-like serine/threonine-protein kinase
MHPIFCPTCHALILDAPSCAACGWQRPYQEDQAGKQLWHAELGRALPKPRASAVVAGGHFCLSAEDGTIMALDPASGQVVWERQIDAGRAAHTLATDGTLLLLSSVDTRPIPTSGKALLALDAATGEDIWSYATIGHSLSAAALANSAAYFTSSDGVLHAVDITSGQARWQVRHVGWGPEAPAVDSASVYVGGRADMLVAYAIGDGMERWRFSAGAWFASPICLAEGQLYTQNWDGFLYALDAATGRLLWKVKGQRGQGFTSPPIAQRDRLYIGGRVYHERDGARSDAYALLALRKDDGGEIWRCLTTKHIVAPPALAGDRVLFGAEDGFFYALDGDIGIERWKIEIGGRIVTQPQIAGHVVYIGERHGVVYAIRWRAEQETQPQAPEEYVRQGAFELAANAYALHSEFGTAAAIFAELGQHREAALLYERAEQPAQAAPLWETLGELRRARDLYQAAADLAGVARMLAALGEPLQAAKLYEEIGDPAAAALYEQAGNRVKAADLYHSAGQIERAAQIWQSLGQWERLADALIGDGNLPEAARLLEQHGQHERAAELYEATAQPAQALALRIQLGHWERVVDLAVRQGDYVQAAMAHEQLGHGLRAAEAYEQAAQQAGAAVPTDEARAAELYERAAQLYEAAFEDQHADQCRRQIRRYRRLPEITVSGGAESAFVEYQWNTLKLRVRNIGHGRATNITLTLRGPFDLDSNTDIASLAPKKTAPLDISVRPQRDQYGPAVPLEIIVTYTDMHGGVDSVRRRIPIRVLQHGAAPETTTPLEINIQNNPQNARRAPQPAPSAMEIKPSPNSSASEEEIDQQQKLLAIHRRNLGLYLEQQAKLGTTFMPPGLSNGIFEERDNIQRIKQVLRNWGIAMVDHPDDSSET